MSRRKRCQNFQWRDEDPTWQTERDNDRIVFRKIRKLTLGGLSADRAIAALFKSSFWQDRMHGKTRASWKRCYYRWRTKCTASPPVFGDSVQAKKCPSDPCKHGAKRGLEKFYREPFLSYPPPTAMVPSAERNTKMTTAEKLSTAPLRTAKKTERKVGKGKGKETSPGSSKNPLSPHGRAREGVPRYRLAGAAAEELIKILGAKPTEDNRRLWAYYCYRHDIAIIFEKAYECSARHRQGEIKNPVTSFQHWLSRTYGKEV